MELTEEQWAALCALAGVEAEAATADEAIAALGAKLEPGDHPDLATVDTDTLNELQELASDGQLWREHKRTDEARKLVQAACDVGKISAASRERWFNYVLSDPEDAKPRLESIRAGTIPRVELGHVGRFDDEDEDDSQDRPRWVR